MTPDVQTIPRKRDLGLDAIRVLAMLLMISVHTFRMVPRFSLEGDLVRFIGEAAPAFFFFAFGMTYPMYAKKARPEQTRQDILFFFVAALHSYYLKRSMIDFDFMFLLFGWRVLLGLYEHYEGRFTQRGLLILLAVLSCLLFWDDLRQGGSVLKGFTPGYFPLVSWGLFCFMGYFYASLKKDSHRFGFGLVLLTLTILVCGLAVAFDGPMQTKYAFLNTLLWPFPFPILKAPVTLPYILAFSSLIVLLTTVINRRSWLSPLFEWLFTRKVSVFISSNLLLFIPLHYYGYHWSRSITKSLFGGTKSAIYKNHEICMVLFCSLIAIAISLILVYAVTWLMKQDRVRRLLAWPASHAVACGFLSLSLVVPIRLTHISGNISKNLILGLLIFTSILLVYDKLFRKEREAADQATTQEPTSAP